MDIDRQFELLKTTRQNALDATSQLSDDQLNFIPDGFNNNLIWNLGHMLITQQRLIYGLSYNEVKINQDLVNQYRIGTYPSGNTSSEDIQYIRNHIIQSIAVTKKDYLAGEFKSYKEYRTSYNITLNSIEDGIIFNNLHEAMHLGYILSLKKFV